MNEAIFTSASLLAVAAWCSLAFALLVPPGTVRSRLLGVAGRYVPLLLCALYTCLLSANWGTAPDGSFASLQGVSNLFAVAEKLLGGWIHFLAFDLLIGRAVIDHGLARGVPRVLLLAILPLLFLYAPAGVMVYLLTGCLWQFGGRWRRGSQQT